jgi:hypothetical protein
VPETPEEMKVLTTVAQTSARANGTGISTDYIREYVDVQSFNVKTGVKNVALNDYTKVWVRFPWCVLVRRALFEHGTLFGLGS